MAANNIREILTESYGLNKEILDLSSRIVKKYSKDLDKVIDEVNNLITTGIDSVPSLTLEFYCVSIPSYLYYLTTGLEEIGIKMDALEQGKKDRYNEVFVETEGPVAIKKAQAEMEVSGFGLACIVYKRAYSCLKEKMDTSTKLYEALKKVLSKRIAEHDLDAQQKS